MSGSIPSWAVRGAKVVCVNPLVTKPPNDGELVKGLIYTIDRVVVEREGPCVFLVEVQRTVRILWWAIDASKIVPFRLDRFRPLIKSSLEQDISLFTPLLQPKRVRGSVDA